jgi:PhnB protein
VKLDVYINYPGTCKDAFAFYEQHLGAKLLALSTHGETPGSRVPPDWSDKVIHARLELGGTVVRGADIPNAEPMRSAYLTLGLDSVEEAERVYALLSEGGQVFMPMEETFFAARFAMLRDRFGTSWMLLHERAA